MNGSRLLRFALINLLCCGCASAPIHYYTLTPPIPVSEQNTAVSCCKVQIKRVLIPPEVDRPELIERSGDYQAVVLSNETWLAPLRDEIRSALSSGINLKLSQAGTTEKSGRQIYSVLVDVTRFESVPGQYALVEADWRVQVAAPTAASPLYNKTTARITIGPGLPASVRGYQQAIGQIADEIALAILNTEHREAQHPSGATTAQ